MYYCILRVFFCRIPDGLKTMHERGVIVFQCFVFPQAGLKKQFDPLW